MRRLDRGRLGSQPTWVESARRFYHVQRFSHHRRRNQEGPSVNENWLFVPCRRSPDVTPWFACGVSTFTRASSARFPSSSKYSIRTQTPPKAPFQPAAVPPTDIFSRRLSSSLSSGPDAVRTRGEADSSAVPRCRVTEGCMPIPPYRNRAGEPRCRSDGAMDPRGGMCLLHSRPAHVACGASIVDRVTRAPLSPRRSRTSEPGGRVLGAASCDVSLVK